MKEEGNIPLSPSSTGVVDSVRVSVDVALVTLTCAMWMALRAVCVLELLYTLNCAVQLLLMLMKVCGCGCFDVVVAFGRSATTTSWMLEAVFFQVLLISA